MDIKQDFRVYCSTNLKELNKSLVETAFQEDGALYLEGIASTTNVDEDGDYMTKSCLEDMKRQAIGLNVLKEHGRTLDDIVGNVSQVLESNGDNFKIKFKVLPRYEYYILELLENDINLGLSIGAKATDYEPNDNSEYGWKINKVKLYEISLVPLPANWDSFGSVKISKELDDNGIVAKCFNGACKLLLKEYSEKDMNKELEDAQKKDDEKYLTEKECINIINEASLEIYERLLSEVIDETKKMIEKYHLDTKGSSNESEKSNDKNDENSSKKKEDEEKEKSMKTEDKETIDVEETPIQKNLEESERTSKEEIEMEKEKETEIKKEVEEKVKKGLEDEEVTVHVSADEISNKDVLKKISEMQNFFVKKFDEELESKVNEKVDAMRDSIRKEVEEELFKDLTTERKPVETEQPEVEKELEEVEEEKVEKSKSMSTHDIAKMLCP